MSISSFFQYPSEHGPASDDFTFLPGANDDEWAKLLAHTEMLRFEAGSTLIRAGDLDRSLYLLTEGTVELLRAEADDGRVLSTLSAPAVIGEVAFFDAKPRSLTVRAWTSCEALRLGFESFEVLAARDARFGRMILLDLGRILAARLRRATDSPRPARGDG